MLDINDFNKIIEETPEGIPKDFEKQVKSINFNDYYDMEAYASVTMLYFGKNNYP